MKKRKSNSFIASALPFFISHWPASLFIISLSLRLVNIADNFWYDETFTAWLAGLDIEHLLKATAGDVHPPLWYLIEWITARLIGSSEAALRLPAVFFSSASAVLIYQLVAEDLKFDAKLARYSSLLFAASPAMIRYAQEARMYSLLTFLVILALQGAIRRDNWRLVPSLALILYTQNIGALYVVAIGLYVLITQKKKAIAPLTLAGACYLPWLPVLLHQFSIVSDSFWIPPSGNPGGLLYNLHFSTFYLRVPDWFSIHQFATAAILTIAAIAGSWKIRDQIAPVALVAFLPPSLLYAA